MWKRSLISRKGDSIVAYWPRPSSSNVLEGLNNESLLPRERIVIDYLDRETELGIRSVGCLKIHWT